MGHHLVLQMEFEDNRSMVCLSDLVCISTHALLFDGRRAHIFLEEEEEERVVPCLEEEEEEEEEDRVVPYTEEDHRCPPRAHGHRRHSRAVASAASTARAQGDRLDHQSIDQGSLHHESLDHHLNQGKRHNSPWELTISSARI